MWLINGVKSFGSLNKLQRTNAVFILLCTSVFVTGAFSSIFDNVIRLACFALLIPEFLSSVKKNMLLLMLSLIHVGLFFVAIFLSPSINTITLEFTYLLLFLSIVALINTNLKLNKVSKLILCLSGLAILAQCLLSYVTTGVAQLLRGDRNHSAVIIFAFYMVFYVVFGRRSLIPFILAPINLSRNLFFPLVVSVFLLKSKIWDFVRRHRYFLLTSFFIVLNTVGFLYVFMLTYYAGAISVGSDNNHLRLLTVFDGSNTLRFKLNAEFLLMVWQSWGDYLIHTGVYSDLKEVFGLYPHNSYLHLIYRVGLIRAVILVYLLIAYARSGIGVLCVVLLFFQAAFIHEVFTTNVLIVYVFIISILNSKNYFFKRGQLCT